MIQPLHKRELFLVRYLRQILHETILASRTIQSALWYHYLQDICNEVVASGGKCWTVFEQHSYITTGIII